VHLISIFDPLAQLIAKQFGIAEVNITYFTLSLIKHTRYNNSRRQWTRAKDSGQPAHWAARDHVIARLVLLLIDCGNVGT